jgi:hypothetical protein
MKKLIFIIIILIVLLAVITWAIWNFWLENFIKEKRKIQEISKWQAPGYEMGAININKEETSVSYQPKENKNKDIQRVTGNVVVRFKTYTTPEEAQQQIEKASLVYIWEWRKEKILNQQIEVNTGFLFSPVERRYKEAYLAWIQDENTYYELISRPADIRDYSDKEYLYESAKEVAEGILSTK